MPPWIQVLKQLAFASLVGLVAQRWLADLDALTLAVFALWVLLAVTREG